MRLSFGMVVQIKSLLWSWNFPIILTSHVLLLSASSLSKKLDSFQLKVNRKVACMDTSNVFQQQGMIVVWDQPKLFKIKKPQEV